LGQGHQDRLLDHQCPAEEIDTKPTFREAFRQRRCLVALDNFYEWKKTATGKQLYAIGLKDGGLMAMAGL
jgi:putative SOS response-associated peptidase YedK